MSRRDMQYDYSKAADREAARGRFPYPLTMNIGNGRFHDALDALDAKDALLREAVRLLGARGESAEVQRLIEAILAT